VQLNRLAAWVAATGACALATACTTTSQVHPEYVSAGLAAPIVSGKAVVVMDSAARGQIINAHPTSLTGAATSLNEPVGAVEAAAAEKIFGAGFSGGAKVQDHPDPDAYDVSLQTDSFSYAYDQLSSLGFAITPKVSVTVTANVAAPGGKAILHKTYSRNDETTGAYVASFQPAEKINQAFHMAIADICREILDDVKAAQ
jgi:uncharacterized lipoprotein YajG